MTPLRIKGIQIERKQTYIPYAVCFVVLAVAFGHRLFFTTFPVCELPHQHVCLCAAFVGLPSLRPGHEIPDA